MGKSQCSVPGHWISETSQNTIVHENVKIYIMNQYVNFFWNFLKFFQKLPWGYIFINCTNLSKFVKFVKIVFNNTYLNFIKLSNISKNFSERQVQNFIIFLKIFTNSFIIYQSFFKTFSLILKFPWSFSEYSSDFFFSKLRQILLKTNTFF